MTALPHPRVGSAAARVRQARRLTQRGAWKTRCGFPPYIRCPVPGARCPVPGARCPGDQAAPVGYLAVGWMTAQPHPRVGSAAARVRQARCLTQRGAWKTRCGFPPYIRRPPPGRSGAPVGYLAVGWMTAPPHPRVGSAAARGRQARCLTQRGAWKTRCGFPPYIRRPPPGRSGGACWAFGRRVDDGAASSTRGFAGCEGPPGSVPYATGRVENASRFSTLHPAPAAREIRRRLLGTWP